LASALPADAEAGELSAGGDKPTRRAGPHGHAQAVAEFLGTCWLVLGGCGAATLSAKFPVTGIGFLGVAVAFGLTLVSGIYALAPHTSHSRHLRSALD
jgi:hypothetical protein